MTVNVNMPIASFRTSLNPPRIFCISLNRKYFSESIGRDSHFLRLPTSSLASLVMEMTYGMEITSKDDRILRAAVEALDLTNRVMVPGAFLVDTVPIRASPEASTDIISPDL